MPLFDNVPAGNQKSQKKGTNWPFSLDYGSEAEIILLDSRNDPAEDQPQYVKTHMMQLTADSGKTYTKRVLCRDYARDLATEESICPLCRVWANMSKEERQNHDWTLGLRAKTELPMSFLVRIENDKGEMEEYRTVRFSPDKKDDWDDEVSKEQKFIQEAYNAAVKNDIGDDTRGLTFKVTRGSKPDSGPKPAGIGEISIPMTGISYTELDDDNPEHKAYTMSEILEMHVVTDEEKIAELMKPHEEE